MELRPPFRAVRLGALAALLLTAAAGFAAKSAAAGAVNIYSYRQPELIQPLLDAFTAETGLVTNVLFLEKGLEERIEAEGRNSPADVILTTDIGRLDSAKSKGITQPVTEAAINSNIPENYRDTEGHWFGLTIRGRVVYASKQRVGQNAITYEELADPKWKGKICVRDGQHVYNVALIASMIANKGAEFAETWLTGVRDNLARKPAGGDRDQAKGVFAGECDIALGNTYYVALMQTNEKEAEQKDWAAAIKVIFPNTADRGTHVNISGMALAKHSPHKDAALKLMTFLASPKAQQIYAEEVFEYPVAPGTKPSAIVEAFGAIKPDPLAIGEIAKFRQQASELVDKTGFNNGPQS